ncbi:beta-lactamase family protein [Dyadobacter sp. CY345]|uniref:serine hydrolase domain-containing protein n=1 Tax=Dyadobacter sp. CY345 TaxID=2909335 RepID=UPI001F4608AF|nr:serine hydrolase [Dyadobacter sp. CY345]MCF2447633.1 beta-lactamase family protein [Dyadobacter sp. CY345]
MLRRILRYWMSLALFVNVLACSNDKQKLVGIWHTEFEAVPHLMSAFDVELRHDFFSDSWSGRFEIPESMAEGTLSGINITDSKIFLDLGQGATFTGSLSKNKTEIKGMLNIPDHKSETLTLRKTDRWSSQRPARIDKENHAILNWNYQYPPLNNDGWKVAAMNLETTNFKALHDLFDNILKGKYHGLDALLVAQNGKLLLDEYFYLGDRERIHSLQSCTKSVTSLLIGIAQNDGLIQNLDAPLTAFFPSYKNSIKEKFPQPTLRNALTMSAGLDWHEDIPYTDPKNDAVLMNQSKDMYRYVLAKNLDGKDKPGKKFEYNSGLSILLGGILSNVTGKPADKYAEQSLFKELGIETFAWTSMNKQIHTGGGLFLRPRDMLKIGQLVLDKGKWNEKQIVPTSWITESTAFVLPINESSSDWGYGYQWWRGVFRVKEKVLPVIYAAGYGGQMLYIVPDLNLSILTLHHNASDVTGSHSLTWKDIEKSILPAFI